MSLAEDLLLLLLDDDTGAAVVPSPRLEALLAGAVVAELVLSGALVVRDDGPLVADGAVPPGLTALAAGLIGADLQPEQAVQAVMPVVLDHTVAGLLERGMVTESSRAGRWRLRRSLRWPATAAGRGDAGLPERLDRVADGRQPGREHELVLLALLRRAGVAGPGDGAQVERVVGGSAVARWLPGAVDRAGAAVAASVAALGAVQASNTVVTSVIT